MLSSFEDIIYFLMMYFKNKYISNGLNLLHPRKDVTEMVIVFCVSIIVVEDFNVCNKIKQTCVTKVIAFCVTPSEKMGSIDQEISSYFNVARNGKKVATTTFPGKKNIQKKEHLMIQVLQSKKKIRYNGKKVTRAKLSCSLDMQGKLV